MATQRATILLSGGIDSTACAAFLLRNGFCLTAVYIRFGQIAANFEQCAATALSAHLGIELQVVTASGPDSFDSGEIVGRNAFLIFTALMYRKSPEGPIALGIHSGTSYYDCSPVFLQNIDMLVQDYTNGQASVIAPFANWSKLDVYQYFLTLDIPVQRTFSCEAGVQNGCGTCASCRDRKVLHAC